MYCIFRGPKQLPHLSHPIFTTGYGNHRLCPLSSPCLVIEDCRCPRSTRLELCKIVQRATKNYVTGHIGPAGRGFDHPVLDCHFCYLDFA